MAKDPYKYFRVEARELVDALVRGALEIEKGSDGIEAVARMLRLAHTLKGASRVVKQLRIAEVAHAIEDLLAPYRDAGSPPAPSLGAPLLGMLDEIVSRMNALEGDTSSPAQKAAPAGEPLLQSVRVDITEMDALLGGITEAAMQIADVRGDVEELSRVRALASAIVDLLPVSHRARPSVEDLHDAVRRVERRLASAVERVDRELDQSRARAQDLRLLPASTVFPLLERSARDAADTLDRAIAFEATGGECRLEAHVLFALRDALLHVVRNAVAHGIEPEVERRRLGKPPAGRVTLHVERRGGRIAFLCSDDGRGIDPASVRRAAVERRVVTAAKADAMGSEEILRLVLESGVTTSPQVTDVSGRGVGLDVLRATAAQLKGDVTITSRVGAGTTIELCVPMSISSVSVLVLEAAGATFALPLDAVQRSLRLAEGDVARVSDRDSVVIGGTAVPFLALDGIVGGVPRDRMDGAWSAVVVSAGERIAVIGADRLVGVSNVVVRPLPKAAGALPIAAGVSLDVEGTPQLLLDARGLVALAHAGSNTVRATPLAERRSPILIVDDSLTTRMLEQSILESAGYGVDLATSGEEGLKRAQEAPHSLFLVDVEMPGIDGFEFVSRTRADPALRAVPAIMVSSCDSAEDRRRADLAGARAYIVKGEFDQSQFLTTIRQLIG